MSHGDVEELTFREIFAMLERHENNLKLEQQHAERLFGTVAAQVFNATGKLKKAITWMDIFPPPGSSPDMSAKDMKAIATVANEGFAGMGIGSRMAPGYKDLTRRDLLLRNWKPGSPLPN